MMISIMRMMMKFTKNKVGKNQTQIRKNNIKKMNANKKELKIQKQKTKIQKMTDKIKNRREVCNFIFISGRDKAKLNKKRYCLHQMTR